VVGGLGRGVVLVKKWEVTVRQIVRLSYEVFPSWSVAIRLALVLSFGQSPVA